jgi:hypothetical protein
LLQSKRTLIPLYWRAVMALRGMVMAPTSTPPLHGLRQGSAPLFSETRILSVISRCKLRMVLNLSRDSEHDRSPKPAGIRQAGLSLRLRGLGGLGLGDGLEEIGR